MNTAPDHSRSRFSLASRRLLASVSIVLLGAVLTAGCDHHSHHQNHPSVEADPFEFVWDGNFDNYYNEEVYLWNTVYDEAVVELDAYDYRGHLIVEIYDATDELIYFHEYIGHGGGLFQIDHTDFGFSGEWVIVITSNDVDGFVTLYVY